MARRADILARRSDIEERIRLEIQYFLFENHKFLKRAVTRRDKIQNFMMTKADKQQAKTKQPDAVGKSQNGINPTNESATKKESR